MVASAMGVLVRVLRRLVGRRSAPADEGTGVGAAHDAMLRTIARQRVAQRRLGTTYVRRADLKRALSDQRQSLDQAHAQIDEAIAAAEHAAAAAREQGDDATPYELAAQGLGDQLAVVDAALAQLREAGERAWENVTRAQRVLSETGAALDAALREQVSLLGRLERLRRQRVIAEAALRAREQDPSR